jgi:hypothetical protein
MPDRILRASICTSETLASLSAEAERLFLRLIVSADDYGRFDGRPAIVRAHCFPLLLDRISEDDVVAWLDELVAADLVQLYQVGGKPYLALTTWSRHQRPPRAAYSRYPEPPPLTGNALPVARAPAPAPAVVNAPAAPQPAAAPAATEDNQRPVHLAPTPTAITVKQPIAAPDVGAPAAAVDACEHLSADVGHLSADVSECLLEAVDAKREARSAKREKAAAAAARARDPASGNVPPASPEPPAATARSPTATPRQQFIAACLASFCTKFYLIMPACPPEDEMAAIAGRLFDRGVGDWWEQAETETIAAGVRNWKYLHAILKRCLETGYPPGTRPAKARSTHGQPYSHRNAHPRQTSAAAAPTAAALDQARAAWRAIGGQVAGEPAADGAGPAALPALLGHGPPGL